MLDLTAIFATFPVLETERFILRAITPDDAPAILHIYGDPRVTRYLARPPLASLDEALRRIDSFNTTFEQQEGICWAVTTRAQRQVVGTCVYFNIVRPHFRAETGYSLAPEWWGQGIMTEAMSAVLAFGFNTMGLHSIEAQIDPENTASRRLLERLGFVQEGHFREDYYDPTKEQFVDTAYFSLLESGWKNRKMGS
jgi:[ribosomal protein S5]-alanine N-acetyltransferase